MGKKVRSRISRREFMRVSAMTAAGVVVVACGADGGPPAEDEAPAAAAASEEASAGSSASSSQYNEAPMLAEMVADGSLPPVERAAAAANRWSSRLKRRLAITVGFGTGWRPRPATISWVARSAASISCATTKTERRSIRMSLRVGRFQRTGRRSPSTCARG